MTSIESLGSRWRPGMSRRLWRSSRHLDAAAVEPVRTQVTDAMKVYERDVLHDVTWHP